MAFVDRNVGFAVAVTAAVFSPEVRRVTRQGAVRGLAGTLKAGDLVASTAQAVARGVQAGTSGGAETPPDARTPA
ncbi:MAG: hypothetical protein ACXVFN_18755 [Solirubrobacteraceae bacterium]